MKYPVYIPQIGPLEKENVNDCLDTTWISSQGKYVNLFEQSIAKYTGAKNAIAVFNGTVALHLALEVLGIKEGDEVIIPDFTYIASANAVLYVNATPVLVDVCKYSWNITLEEIKKNITTRTKAIMITDIYGTPPEMDEIIKFAKVNNIYVIADSAESIGATYKNKNTGNIADISTFSFFGNKTITTGEGGMITTNNDTFDKSLRKLKNQGNHETIRYYHDVLGYNYRMTNIQAAIGCAQMERIDETIEKKRMIFEWYYENLSKYVTFQKIPDYISSSYWMVSFLLSEDIDRDKLMIDLKNEGIDTRPFFSPIHKMPFYENVNNKNTIEISKRGINVPSYPQLSKKDINLISKTIIKYITK